MSTWCILLDAGKKNIKFFDVFVVFCFLFF